MCCSQCPWGQSWSYKQGTGPLASSAPLSSLCIASGTGNTSPPHATSTTHAPTRSITAKADPRVPCKLRASCRTVGWCLRAPRNTLRAACNLASSRTCSGLGARPDVRQRHTRNSTTQWLHCRRRRGSLRPLPRGSSCHRFRNTECFRGGDSFLGPADTRDRTKRRTATTMAHPNRSRRRPSTHLARTHRFCRSYTEA